LEVEFGGLLAGQGLENEVVDDQDLHLEHNRRAGGARGRREGQ
jgi:hypothetical protein